MSIADRIRAARERAGLSQDALGQAVGVKQSSVAGWEAGTNAPRRSRMRQLAQALGVSGEWLEIGDAARGVEKTGLPELAPKFAPGSNARPVPDGTPAPPLRSQMPRDLPVYGTAAGSVSGAMQADMTEAVDLVLRPPILVGARDAYALYVVGDSMSPRYDDGELIYVHPHRPVRPGDDVVIQMRNHDTAPVEVMIKRLVRRTAAALIVRQLNPPDVQIEIRSDVVKALHKVLTLNDLMGI